MRRCRLALLPAVLVVGFTLAPVPASAVVQRYTYLHTESRPPSIPVPQFFVADTEAELSTLVNVREGDLAYAKDTDAVLKRTGTAWVALAGGSGAPTTATYITQTADAGLSAEQALSVLTTGIVKVTNGTGVLSTAIAGDFPTLNQSTTGTAAALTSNGGNCSGNNFALGVDAAGVGECAQPAFSNLSGSATDAQVPNTITIDLSAAATALAADPANCSVSTEFAVGVNASGVATCEAISDADVPNTITIDLATSATGIPTYTLAGLPAAGTTGRLAIVTATPTSLDEI